MRRRYACRNQLFVFVYLKQRKRKAASKPCYHNPFQSLNESHIPNALLERLVMGAREFPPVCAIIGGILGQVNSLSLYLLVFLPSVQLI